VLIVLKSGSLSLQEHSGPVHSDNGTALPNTLTLSVEKTVNLLHGFKLVYKPGNINVLLSVDRNSMAAHLTGSECIRFQEELYMKCSEWH